MHVFPSPPDLSVSHPILGRVEARNKPALIIACAVGAAVLALAARELVQVLAAKQLTARS